MVNGQSIEQVLHFNSVHRHDVSYETEIVITSKLHKYHQPMCGTIHCTLSNKTTRETKLTLYMAVASNGELTNWCERWALRKQHTQRIQAAEKKFLIPVKACSLCEKIRNEVIKAEDIQHERYD